MSNAKTDFPVTKNWIDRWQSETVAIGTDVGVVTNDVEEVVKKPDDNGYTMLVRMSVMK